MSTDAPSNSRWLKDAAERAGGEVDALFLARKAIEHCLKVADRRAAERDAALAHTAAQAARIKALEEENERLRDVVMEFDRMSLVIDSAIRLDQPGHAKTISDLIFAARAALIPSQETRA